MLVFLLTAAMVAVLQFRHYGCVRPPTRNPSVLDRMPQGLGKRDLPHLPALLVDLGTHLAEHPIRNENDAFHPDTLTPLQGTHPVISAFRRPRPSSPSSPPHLLHGFHDLGTLLRRRHHQDSRPQLEPFQKIRGGLLPRERSQEGDKEEKDARLVLFYTLPRSSDKRGRRGWRPRGRRGKGWALGGKRQAVLDRMPLSYGKKREARTSSSSSSFSSEELRRPEGEEEMVVQDGSDYRGKVEAENRLEPV